MSFTALSTLCERDLREFRCLTSTLCVTREAWAQRPGLGRCHQDHLPTPLHQSSHSASIHNKFVREFFSLFLQHHVLQYGLQIGDLTGYSVKG